MPRSDKAKGKEKPHGRSRREQRTHPQYAEDEEHHPEYVRGYDAAGYDDGYGGPDARGDYVEGIGAGSHWGYEQERDDANFIDSHQPRQDPSFPSMTSMAYYLPNTEDGAEFDDLDTGEPSNYRHTADQSGYAVNVDWDAHYPQSADGTGQYYDREGHEGYQGNPLQTPVHSSTFDEHYQYSGSSSQPEDQEPQPSLHFSDRHKKSWVLVSYLVDTGNQTGVHLVPKSMVERLGYSTKHIDSKDTRTFYAPGHEQPSRTIGSIYLTFKVRPHPDARKKTYEFQFHVFADYNADSWPVIFAPEIDLGRPPTSKGRLMMNMLAKSTENSEQKEEREAKEKKQEDDKKSEADRARAKEKKRKEKEKEKKR